MTTIEKKNRDGELVIKVTTSSEEDAYTVVEIMQDADLDNGTWDYYNYYIDGKLLA